MSLVDELLENPYCPCPERCDPHQPGMGWPLMKMIGSKNGREYLWCDNCFKPFTPSMYLEALREMDP